jgi:2-iminobutanoate/2-iminopropanoate deaminase
MMNNIFLPCRLFFLLTLVLSLNTQTMGQNHEQTIATNKIIATDKAPKAIGPYSQAIVANGFVFVSGQTIADPATGALVEGGIKEQTRQVIKNIQAVLEEANSDLDRVVKVTVFISDWKYFKEMNEVYAEFFSRNAPARSTIQGQRWPEGTLIGMDVIATTK